MRGEGGSSREDYMYTDLEVRKNSVFGEQQVVKWYTVYKYR